MKKKIVIILLTAILLALMLPMTSFAFVPPPTYDTVTIDDAYIATNGNTYTIAGTDYTLLRIDTTQPVIVTQSSSTPTKYFAILAVCNNVDLTIDSVSIKANYISDPILGNTGFTYAMVFLGTGNTLTLVGDNKLEGYSNPGVSVSSGAELTIEGSGSLTAIGGTNSAGIGGGYDTSGGIITINSGTIDAMGGNYGAGIGGGKSGNAGTISVTGGRVIATGNNAAGIGSGYQGDGGAVSISGGVVFADGWRDDIGDALGSDGTVSISGSSAVFLKDNWSNAIITVTHTLHDDEDLTGTKAYGYTLPTTWTSGTAFAWLAEYTVTYEHGSNATFEAGVTTTEKVHGELSPSNAPTVVPNKGYQFTGWTDGIILGDLEDFTITSDTTLTAVMGVKTVSDKTGDVTGKLVDSAGNPLAGYKITIHSTPATTTTDANGVFRFSGVSFDSHTLFIRNASSTLIEQFSLIFTKSNATSSSISGDTITLLYKGSTALIHLDLQANAALDGVSFLDATFVANAINPQTSEQTWFDYVVGFFKNIF